MPTTGVEKGSRRVEKPSKKKEEKKKNQLKN
jgi:hypothetical protein